MVQIKSSLLFCVFALAAVSTTQAAEMQTANGSAALDPAALTTSLIPVAAPAAAPSAASPASATTSDSLSAKKARGEISAGGTINVGNDGYKKGGFKAGGEIGTFTAGTAADAGVGSGAVTGPVSGFKAKGQISKTGERMGATALKRKGGLKAGGEIATFKGEGTNGEAVSGKHAKGDIAAGGEIHTKNVNAIGGFKANGELSSLTGAVGAPSAPIPVGGATAATSEVLKAQGIDTNFGEGKYYRRTL